jgi:hypothetical protein
MLVAVSKIFIMVPREEILVSGADKVVEGGKIQR